MPSLSSRVSSSSSAYPSVRSPSSSSKESVCLPRDCERWPAAAASPSPSPSAVLGHSVVQVLPIAFPGGKCHFYCVKHICKKGKCGIFGPRSQLHTDNFFDFLNIFLIKTHFSWKPLYLESDLCLLLLLLPPLLLLPNPNPISADPAAPPSDSTPEEAAPEEDRNPNPEVRPPAGAESGARWSTLGPPPTFYFSIGKKMTIRFLCRRKLVKLFAHLERAPPGRGRRGRPGGS